eukprot:m.433284 g.433284  ORF g.433284 m.433284 type:complete len:220 (-) comp17556_c0_seq1:2648-3307(-)
MLRLWCLAGLVAAVLPSASGLYFHIKEGEVKCFIEEVPDETMVTGSYRVQKPNPDGSFGDSDENSQGIGIHVKVKDPTGDIVMDKDYAGKGRFVFNTHEAGEHQVCLSTNSTRWFSGGGHVRVHLAIKVGEAGNDYDTIQKKEQLTQMETRLYQLLAQVRQIANEQAYQRTREATFRQISESTNVRVLWWSIAQAGILIIIAALQLRHLRGFFEAKKLV